ncbi:Ppx/GppA phosphatase family protein [Comamonas sp. UBA7528]|uniref:Ppx/GppA phosphatase family protein n=1 Tax=Comamonas sp. UBA7528 TaxID=1946391 RepID=UPI0025C72B17|nr:Ppx/GppA phosphatase family protein [Comamonas sp. UBA7528]
MPHATTLAAIDLGSNSFRLEIGSYEHLQIQRVEYLKETVRQGNGLDEERNLTPEAMERGWACLARFGERLRGFDPQHVRAVATQTLREARNREAFVQRGSELLGFPIDVISGEDEARLIYRGVVSQLPMSDERRLVMDIGGRSTEFVLGHGVQAEALASYRIGSVAWSMRYFPQGVLTAEAFANAELAARAVLDEALDTFRPGSWDCAYASAGTANAVGEVLIANGRSQGVIDRDGLDWLLQQLLRAQTVDRIRLEGMREDRRPMLAGGISIMRAAFHLLGIDSMQIAQGALRQGVLHDLIDADLPTGDLRTASVQALANRFAVDTAHGRHVADTAQHLWRELTGGTQPQHHLLEWAGLLHEVGQRINRSDYHRHSAYILQYSGAKGFAEDELLHLALLVLGHRGKLKKVEDFIGQAPGAMELLALRLAVILCHARQPPQLQGMQLLRRGASFTLRAPAHWSQQFPQSAHLLAEEVDAWSRTPWKLQLLLN